MKERERDHDKMTETNVDDILYKIVKILFRIAILNVRFIRASHLGVPWNKEKYS